MTVDRALVTDGLTKSFRGRRAVDGVGLSVRRGEIVGFLGPNGAGKTTVMGMVTGLVAPDAGHVELLGIRDGQRRKDVLMRVGFLQEKPSVYPEMTARAYLAFFARLYGLDAVTSRVGAALERVGLSAAADRRAGTFSRGMQQRLCLARVLMHRPEFLILDEPTLGLDPEGVADMRAIFREMREAGATLLFSSHQLAEMERVCDSVIFMKDGRIVASGRQADLASAAGARQRLTVEIFEEAATAATVLLGRRGLSDIRAVDACRIEVALDPALTRDARTDRATAAKLVAAAGFTVLAVAIVEPTLEDLFLGLTATPAAGASSPFLKEHAA
ncbi:ABC transporter ATP-binding protein [Ensifer soli]|uniref:ABC transporter ATP-binding protein n=1 Tax=Ciceribacter sp. sgz301302 TaxID=3342379 RepID=UPI0035BAE976